MTILLCISKERFLETLGNTEPLISHQFIFCQTLSLEGRIDILKFHRLWPKKKKEVQWHLSIFLFKLYRQRNVLGIGKSTEKIYYIFLEYFIHYLWKNQNFIRCKWVIHEGIKCKYILRQIFQIYVTIAVGP